MGTAGNTKITILSSQSTTRFIEGVIGVLSNLLDIEPPIIDVEGRLAALDISKKDLQGNVDPIISYRVGEVLYREERPTMSELSKALHIPKASTTRLIDWWVKKNLAERLSDPNDGRIIRVTLTDKGREFHEIMRLWAERKVESILGKLTEHEQIILEVLLDKLTWNSKPISPFWPRMDW